MSAKWFTDCTTIEQAKQLYRKLAKRLHPDNGGNEKEFVDMQNEFESFCKNPRHSFHENSTNGTTKNSEPFDAKLFMDIINKLATIPGIDIEICGSWLWITGNTYPYKDYLKEIGCRWSVGKKKWYWTESPYQKRSSKKSMNRIRAEYGSQKVNISSRPVLE